MSNVKFKEDVVEAKVVIISQSVKVTKLENIEEAKPISFLQKAKNASLAIRKIVASGGKLVDKDTRVWRGKICENCPFWQKDGNMGLGECTKCGCTKYKRLFEAQGCPLKKW